MKKVISVLLTTVMLIAMIIVFPTSASARTRVDTGFDNWMGFKNDDGTLTITGCRNIGEYLYDKTLTIPSTVKGMKVTGVGMYNGDQPFYIFDRPQWDINAIVLPDTVENVERVNKSSWPYVSVFGAYTGIEKLVLPKNSNFDEDDAENLFHTDVVLSKLKEVDAYNKSQVNGILYDIWDNRATNIEKITLHNGKDCYLSSNDFPSLKEFSIASSCEDLTLNGLNNFTKVDLSRYTSLRELYVKNMTNLQTLVLPSSLVTINLSSCPKLTTMTYPKNIKNLSIEKLANCPKLNLPIAYINKYTKTLDDGSTWTSSPYLGCDDYESPFENSTIQELHIASDRIAYGADKNYFTKMPKLQKFVIEGNNSKYYTRDGVLYWGNYYYDSYGSQRYANDLVAYPAAKSTTGTLNLLADTTCIYIYALDSCKFSSITIPENIHKDYYWDRKYFFTGENGEGEYKNITDFYTGKLRMVKNSAADDSYWFDDESRIDYYKGNTYRISYQLNGGVNNAANPNTYVAGNSVTLKNPTKTGYTFLGWTRNDSDSSTDYNNTTERGDYFKDLTFTAHWKKAVTMPATPKISTVSNTTTGVKITWSKVSGAAKYRVFIKKNGKWTKLADTVATSYTHKAVKSGTKYTYTVRCISKDGKKYTSKYNTIGKSVTYIATPALPTLKNTKNGVQVSWKKPAGAVKYRVFRKTGSGGWKKLADTTALKYIDKSAKKGETYTYTIRCISANGKTYTSAYNTTGRKIKCVR